MPEPKQSPGVPVGQAPGRAVCPPVAGTWDGLPRRRVPLPGRGHGDRALVWLSPPIRPQPQGSRRGWLALNHG